MSKLPNCQLYFSSPIVRFDDAAAAARVVDEINKRMRLLLTILLVNNSNIGYDEVGWKGLHLNDRGTRKLAVNFINILKMLYP